MGIMINIKKPLITQGLLTTWLRCPREAFFFLQGYSPVKTNPAFQYGDITHRALDTIYSWYRRKRIAPSPEFAGQVVSSEVSKYRDEHPIVDEQLLAVQEAQIMVMISEYIRYWGEDDFTGKVKWDQPEQVFQLQLGKYVLTGKIDGSVLINKKPWLFETKNYSRINISDMLGTLKHDFQSNFYMLALQHLTGVAPVGLLYNIIRKPQSEQHKGESLYQYMKRLRKIVRSKPSHYFIRMEVPILKSERQRFAEELEIQLDRFQLWLQEGMPNWRYGMPCVTKYGLCWAHKLCYYGQTREYKKRKDMYPELTA